MPRKNRLDTSDWSGYTLLVTDTPAEPDTRRRQMLCSNGHCWYIAFTLFLDIPNYFPDGKKRAAFIEKHKLQCPKCGSGVIMAANEGPDPDE